MIKSTIAHYRLIIDEDRDDLLNTRVLQRIFKIRNYWPKVNILAIDK